MLRSYLLVFVQQLPKGAEGERVQLRV